MQRPRFDPLAWLLMLGYLASPATAAESSPVRWHTDVGEAWKSTQQQGRLMLVFVTHEQCVFCKKMERTTYADRVVAREISDAYVPLALDGGGNSALLRDLKVTAFPTTVVISPEAVVIDRVEGYVPPETLAKRLAALGRNRATDTVARTP